MIPCRQKTERGGFIGKNGAHSAAPEEKRKEASMKEKKTDNSALAIGMCLGISIGTAIGAAMHNMGLWMPIGLSVGLCLGLALGQKPRDDGGDGPTDKA